MIWIKIGSLFMFLGVGIGAFGAHALKNNLTAYGQDIFKTAVMYHMFHATAMLILGVLTYQIQDPKIHFSGISFLSGIFLFSGSLYMLAVTQLKWLGAITPLGGLSFLLGWLFLMLIRG
ncbi:MAG: DUF423 domain-containing protein [Candidatus Omnitrophica bacterium]|nr:DUF423 domain-containing protein [Candidatus Omnitrophota bacterium]